MQQTVTITNHVTDCYYASVGQIHAEALFDLDEPGGFALLLKIDFIWEKRGGPAHGSQSLLPVDHPILFGGDDPYRIVSGKLFQFAIRYKSLSEDLGPPGLDSGQTQPWPAQDECYNGPLQVGQLPQGVYGRDYASFFGRLYGLPLLLDMGVEALSLWGGGELLQGFQAFIQSMALLGE